jgi:beta-lactamase regulating signal transducer with metallopeptidase domain
MIDYGKIPQPLWITFWTLLVVSFLIGMVGYFMSGGTVAAASPGASLAGASPVNAPTNEKKEKLGTKLCICGSTTVVILWIIGSILGQTVYSKKFNSPVSH